MSKRGQFRLNSIHRNGNFFVIFLKNFLKILILFHKLCLFDIQRENILNCKFAIIYNL